MALIHPQAARSRHRTGVPSNAFDPAPDSQRTLVGTSFAMRRVHEIISRVAPVDSTVLICGESGTGKELAARHIHQASRRGGAPFVAIDCAALTEPLLESKLFGREYKKGTASAGTLFLDEISALAPPLQSRLLRLLKEWQAGPGGGPRRSRIDVRLIASTNTDLEAAASRGAFRPDLYYRLRVISITMPPLREHPEDIVPLVDLFVQEFGQCRGRRLTGVSLEALSLLMRYPWPGNVRELRNAVEHACVTGTSEIILPQDLPENILRSPGITTTPGSGRATAGATLARNASGGIMDDTGTPLEKTEVAAWNCGAIGKTISHYRIIEKLGAGGMGVVYKAKDTLLERVVALKFPVASARWSKDEKVRFLRGAKAAAAVNHPNVCTIHDLGQAGGQPFLVMEYVAGEVLRQKIRRKPLALEEALRLAIEIGRGLQAAHNQGVIHRDIKSSNIIVTPDGLPKIMDFGLAWLTGCTQITKAGTVVGTPAYMSPEQLQGKPADQRSDLWSLAVVLYEMITGRLPFRCDSEAAAVHSILYDDPEPVTALRAGLTPHLARVVGKALAKCPEERYQYMDDLLADLRAVRNRLPPHAPPAAADARHSQRAEPHARTVTL